jgi:hypothetical protein
MCRIRAVLILCVALAYAGAPLALDACARSCARVAPACHHESAASLHIGHLPDLCGHEHDVVRAVQPGANGSKVSAAVANLPAVRPAVTVALFRRDPRDPSRPPLVRPSITTAPLRI